MPLCLLTAFVYDGFLWYAMITNQSKPARTHVWGYSQFDVVTRSLSLLVKCV